MVEKSFEIVVPAKTFIVGEYLALKGGPSLIAATGPGFSISLSLGKRGTVGIHPESPAGRFFFQKMPNISKYSFTDGIKNLGGFGRSTAEYLALYLAAWLQEDKDLAEINVAELVKEYQRLATTKNFSPSGADLVAQLKGGLCLYDGRSFEAQSFNWPWPNKSFFIFYTGKKVPTHSHLEYLEDFNTQALQTIAEKAIHCFLIKDFFGFCQCVEAYSDELYTMDLFDDEVHDRVSRLRQFQTIDLAKGCGAMGMDTIFVIGDRTNEENIIQQAKNFKFQYVAGLGDLAQGTKILGK